MCDFAKCHAKASSLMVFNCKNCNMTFCMKHRMPEDHACAAATAGAAAKKDAAATATPLFSKKEKFGLSF